MTLRIVGASSGPNHAAIGAQLAFSVQLCVHFVKLCDR